MLAPARSIRRSMPPRWPTHSRRPSLTAPSRWAMSPSPPRSRTSWSGWPPTRPATERRPPTSSMADSCRPAWASNQGAALMKRIVVVGGGFGGVAAAQRLDRMFRHDDGVEIVLVSDKNFLVYTPMLADVAGGTIEPRHAVPPVRAFLKKATFREATVQAIDVEHRT